MPLTPEERAFLDAYVYEATHDPFGGPATSDLKRRNIYYHDLSWILTAYQRELCAGGEIPDGVKNPQPPLSPWKDLNEVRERDAALRQELRSYEDREGHRNGGTSPESRGPLSRRDRPSTIHLGQGEKALFEENQSPGRA